MKVLHRRHLWESIFAQMWSRSIYQRWSQKEVMSFRKNKRFWSVCSIINDCKCMIFIKVLLRTYLLLKPGFSQKKRTINWWVDLLLSILTESKVSKLCGCLTYIMPRVHLREENEIALFRKWFPSVIRGMICIWKSRFLATVIKK